MLVIVLIASIIELCLFCKSNVLPELPPCQPAGNLVYSTLEYDVRYIRFEGQLRYIRIFRHGNLEASNMAENYLHELRRYVHDNEVTDSCTDVELTLLICRQENGMLGVITRRYAYLRLGAQVVPIWQPTPTRILQAVLTGIITYHSAGLSDLRLNEDNIKIHSGRVFILSGPTTLGPYRLRLHYMAPELLMDAHQNQAHPWYSDIWFAGALYFRLLTRQSLIPYAGPVQFYGDMEQLSYVQDESTLSDTERMGLRSITYSAWLIMLSGQPIVIRQALIDSGINVVAFEQRRDELGQILQSVHANAPTQLLLRQMLGFDCQQRTTPTLALQSIQNILQNEQQP